MWSAFDMMNFRDMSKTIWNPKFKEGPFHIEFKDIRAYKNKSE